VWISKQQTSYWSDIVHLSDGEKMGV
jgi:hypothetical protein